MAGLAETTARLKRLRPGPAPRPRRAARRMKEVRDFGANPGALRMLSYCPQPQGRAMPLVVVLHGCGQGAEAFTTQAGWIELADRFGFMVIAPEQSAANNPNRCFNWFEPHDVERGEGECASIAAMIAHAVSSEALDPRRVFVTGLSAGGAMTVAMLAAYPEVFAAGAVVAGLPYGVARGVASALGAMQGGGLHGAEDLGLMVRAAAPANLARPRITIWHGEADHTVRPQNALDVAAQWVEAHGLSQDGGEDEVVSRWKRTTWRDPASDQVMVELNLAPGLGHGAPLSTLGADGLGSVAPYMLEAGISSSLEIARFWGLAEALASPTKTADDVGSTAPTKSPLLRLGDKVIASVAPHVSPAVQSVIGAALKQAGLRR